VKALQEKLGSRASYSRLENNTYVDGLTESETSFIQQKDSFYMAPSGKMVTHTFNIAEAKGIYKSIGT
jgi:hypothetical protein